MTEQQEKMLRLHLATMCMAYTSGREGDLKEATNNVVNFVRDLHEQKTSEPKDYVAGCNCGAGHDRPYWKCPVHGDVTVEP